MQAINVSAVPCGCHSAASFEITVTLVISTSHGGCSAAEANKAHREKSNQITWNQAHIHQMNKHYELMRNLARHERWSPSRWAPSFEAQIYQLSCIYLLKHQGGIVSLALISPEPQIRSVVFSFRPFKFLYKSYCNRCSVEIFKVWLSNKWALCTVQPCKQSTSS